ncbi:hypothetical protein SAMN05216359_11278 [Roseateles sp. YR242]|uniref:iron uptake protein n=1 Tax=Roseateles sp. YR242 TaxID=1855305 RepID=UPI0008D6163B|nr:iron uptake protein [Roseateles sp. YR242]SEL61984.1 hypothetical protein SAMN05216359_11278 [Roseateles sp. YR242]
MNTSTTLSRASLALPLILRITAAVGGGYVFCWGFVALGLAGFYASGMSFHDAEHFSGMLGVLLYLVVFCWTFAAKRLARVWAVLLVGAGVMTGAAALVQRAML